ncbi:hypothetical protein NIES592_23490 [Fischerella major NIES-592]|uniref:Transmembrane protein n=2 Tax=Fischerella TaxID=1190 RepID=A0A1U7GSS6_9CYAN|nr:hypothetical protein NIES592_23490 [Fischerella major NIES-592]PMB41453.1 hypothetical protein CEN41_17240 [Fischerella thermalis CCMEE 5330]
MGIGNGKGTRKMGSVGSMRGVRDVRSKQLTTNSSLKFCLDQWLIPATFVLTVLHVFVLVVLIPL